MTGPRTTWHQRRTSLGISLRELSRRSGVNRGSISRIERGWPASAAEAEALIRVLSEAERDQEAAS